MEPKIHMEPGKSNQKWAKTTNNGGDAIPNLRYIYRGIVIKNKMILTQKLTYNIKTDRRTWIEDPDINLQKLTWWTME